MSVQFLIFFYLLQYINLEKQVKYCKIITTSLEFSELNENFGKTFLVWLVLKNVGFILYDWANELLPSIIDFSD